MHCAYPSPEMSCAHDMLIELYIHRYIDAEALSNTSLMSCNFSPIIYVICPNELS